MIAAFAQVWTTFIKSNFGRTDWTLICVSTHIWFFFSPTYFLGPLLLSCSATCYNVYYTRYPFYLWQIQLSKKQCKLQTQYVTSCQKIFHFYFNSSIKIKIFGNNSVLAKAEKSIKKCTTGGSCNLSNISFWHKANLKSTICRKLLNLKLFPDLMFFVFRLNKSFGVTGDVKNIDVWRRLERFALTDNQWQNISQIINKLSKI